jgi:hypothetical protein
MKKILLILLTFFSTLIYANDILRISLEEQTKLNEEFSRKIEPVMERFGSGDVVGNGGGLLEQNFMLSYYSLQTAIDNCLTFIDCFNSKEEKAILIEINKLFIQKIDQKNIFVFVKNKDHNNFFYDENDQTQRIAKTGFDKKYPIFINLDVSNEIINDVPAMLGIIIHELGHQVGILSHNFLDQLGARVRSMWMRDWVVSKVVVGSEKLSVRLFTAQSNFINSKLSYVFKGKVQSLNFLIYREISCGEGEMLHGFSLSNGHWKRPDVNPLSTIIKKTFWIDVLCEDIYSRTYQIKKDMDIIFEFDISNQIQVDLVNVKARLR